MRNALKIIVLLSSLGLVTALPAAALQVERDSDDAPPPRELAWSNGRLAGGDIRTIAIDPVDPDHLLAGTASGQIFRSRNGGESWTDAGAPIPFTGWVVSDLLFDPERSERVWVALRGMLGEEGFVALSDDDGATWQGRSEGLPMRQVYALARAPKRVYAATRQGVWGSEDDGQSWRHLTGAHPEIQKVTSLLVDSTNADRILAGTWRRAYRSEDGGATWHGVFEGMVLDSEVFSLHSVPGRAGELWASTCGWVYRGEGWGLSWQRLNKGLEERRTPSFQVLADGTRLAGTVEGVYRSDDDGASWELVTSEEIVALALEHHPDRPSRVFIGTEGAGVWRSSDGGRTFEAANWGLHAVRVASLAAVGGEVLAAIRHAGPGSGVYSSFDEGRNFFIGPAKIPTVVELVAEGQTVYAATDDGLWRREDDSWSRIDEVGRGPVRQVATGGGQTVARSDRGVFLSRGTGERFDRVAFDHGPVASVAIEGETLWILGSESGLYRLTDGEMVATATPIKRGRLHAVGGRLLVSGAGELWERAGLDAAWKDLGRRRDFHPTGNSSYPLLIVDGDGVGRLVGASDEEGWTIGLTVPARDLSAVLVRDAHVLLGTSGYGLLVGELEGRSPPVLQSAR